MKVLRRESRIEGESGRKRGWGGMRVEIRGIREWSERIERVR